MPPDSPIAPLNQRIVAQSQRQAMDWSLVLASQGIEHIVDHSPERGWALLVSEADQAGALAAIRLYRLESRRWPWQKAIPRTEQVFDGLAIAWVLLTVLFYWLSNERPAIEEAGIVNGAAVADGQWWRLVTGTLLHANLAHLAANAGFGFLFLGLAMGRYGAGLAMLGALVAGVGGNLLSWLAHGYTFRGLGASGVVMGALGLITVQSFNRMHHPRAGKVVLAGLAAGLMLFVLLGVSPETDVIAHFGGFVSGIATGLLLRMLPRSFTVNAVAALLFVFLVLWSWRLALRHVG
ncbi:MAG TPA: rhomboid family intramembrane serine protease [Verrucomicrobiae bacterium]|nr:rhomboid family intramembrane serine protease [Verrucomicrobiae bacterium]